MNHKLYAENDPKANEWANHVERTFKRDAELMFDYNNIMSGGKWKNMMIQKHIGYTSWNDNFRADVLPKIYRIDSTKTAGGYSFSSSLGYVSMEAEHFFQCQDAALAKWTVIPHLGRTLSGIALMPYTKPVKDAFVTYKFNLPKGVETVKVHIIVKSTLAFQNSNGHEYQVGLEDGFMKTVNFNGNMNEKPENIYSNFYPTVARRVIEKTVELNVPVVADEMQTLKLLPLSPGIVFEKIVVDFGGYKRSYLFMNESPKIRK